MRTTCELQKLLSDYKTADCHVHTHLCDGNPDMTVENIARAADERNIGLVILTPHFHKKVSDLSDTLFTDTDESIFFSLREEIDSYERNDGKIKFLLSAEADIISADGELSLTPSAAIEKTLDLLSPTLNYHPLLPLYFVRLTYGKYVNALHESGEYLNTAEKIGGIDAVLETAYKTQINAIENCPFPMMLGHFFMSQSAHPDTRNCFGAEEKHFDLMKRLTRAIILTCKRKNAFLDLTGVHLHESESAETCKERNGFLSDFHRFTVGECLQNGVTFGYGSDAHSLKRIGASHKYYDLILHSAKNFN